MVYYIGSIPYASDELTHFGINGMKWGVRRFQNPDGSLTLAGRARYGSGDERSGDGWNAKTTKVYKGPINGNSAASAFKSSEKAFRSSAEIADRLSKRRKPSKAFSRNVSKMSDDELRKRVNRLNLERQYAQLTGADTRAGAEFARELLQSLGAAAGLASSALGAAFMIKKLRG